LRVKIKREDGVIAVVANRAKRNTLVYLRLEKFLDSLGIPFVATLRDTQQYIKACEAGEGIFEMRHPNSKDIESWQPLLAWLQQREQVYLAAKRLQA
jgi:chromosome partitioning protein